MLRLVALLAAVAVAVCARPAHADPAEKLALGSFAAGLAVAMVPLAVGGGLAATADPSDQNTKRTGIYIIATGLALAPIVSHLIAREWKRAAIFGAISVPFSVVAVSLLATQPDIIDAGTPPPRVAFGACLAIEIFASAAGLVDSFMAGDRLRRRTVIVPLVGRGQVGLAVGGFL